MFEEDSFVPSLNELSPAVTREGKDRLAQDVSAQVISLDLVHPADESFLYQTYASTRAEEMALTGWNAEQQETFLRMQYEAQRRSYLMQLPEAKYWVIRCDQIAVGRLIINRTPEEIHIVDIALLPEFRKQGIGSTLMAAIMTEGSESGKTVRLHVERFNPALHWYERLGFSAADAGPVYLEMIWRPSSQLSGSSAVVSEPEQASGVAHVSD